MASDKQIAANQANAQLATGPKSDTGKARSSQNALKTGIDAKSEVIRFENREAYDALIAAYYDRFHPTVPEERALVDMLITSEWLGRRYACVDTSLWERGFNETNTASLSLVFSRAQQAFDRLDRRINSAQRNFQRALKQLTEIQANRANQPGAAALPPVDVVSPPESPVSPDPDPKPLTPELVSFLSPIPETPATPETTPATPNSDPKTEDLPPIAA